MTGREPPQARPAKRRRTSSIGLALAGGGPLGGIYEVGTLLALSDSIEHLDFGALDVYVGVSSGSYVAAALANGISPAQMYRLFIDNGKDAALRPELFLRPALREFRRRLTALPALAARASVANDSIIPSCSGSRRYWSDARARCPPGFSTIGRSTPS